VTCLRARFESCVPDGSISISFIFSSLVRSRVIPLQTGCASRVFHTDYHWDRLCSYYRTSPTLDASLLSCDVPSDVLVMCCIVLFCDVPRPSDTSIVVLGFVTHSTVWEELQSRLVNVYNLCA
jgi:hypothetical protein